RAGLDTQRPGARVGRTREPPIAMGGSLDQAIEALHPVRQGAGDVPGAEPGAGGDGPGPASPARAVSGRSTADLEEGSVCQVDPGAAAGRSEERRVGKERRARWYRVHDKKRRLET